MLWLYLLATKWDADVDGFLRFMALVLSIHAVGVEVQYGIDDHFDRSSQERTEPHVAWLDGILSYAQSIEPELVNKWQQVFSAALSDRRRRLAASARVED